MRVFITGASSGLGAALALHHAREGTTLGLVARRHDLLSEVAEAARARGAEVTLHPADVADPLAIGGAAAAFGPADLVIANAGMGLGKKLVDASPAEVARLFAVNVAGVTSTLLPFLPGMRARGQGVLCAVSSMAGHRALPGHAPYAASKAAVITFMDGLRMDLAGSGVHAMTVCPGFVHTAMTEGKKGMLWPMSVEAAVAEITGAIARKERTYSFPWQMRVMKQTILRLPETLLRRVLSR
jgi:short-subunit dehydrogenase